MKCPRCEKDMEHGYLSAEKCPEPSGYPTIQASWEKERNPFGSGEDPIALPDDDCGSFAIEGERCSNCRVLLLSY